MTREQRLELLKQIEKDIHVCSLESTFLDDAKSCAIHSAIEELEQEPKTGQWIPCSERLPEDYTEVIAWFEYFRYGSYNRLYQTCGIGCYSSEYDSWMINNETGWSDLKVYAWLPMPAPYKEDEQDDQEI